MSLGVRHYKDCSGKTKGHSNKSRWSNHQIVKAIGVKSRRRCDRAKIKEQIED